MRTLLLACLSVLSQSLLAQQQTLDVFTYTPPKGWTVEKLTNGIGYTNTNALKNAWCRIQLVTTTVSTGDAATDLSNEWRDLVATTYNVVQQPGVKAKPDRNGWQVKQGTAAFTYSNNRYTAVVTTFSNGKRRGSVLGITTGTDYLPAIQEFMEDVQVAAPNCSATEPINASNKSTGATKTPDPSKKSFAFGTTNFDDGWTSVAREDWVEVTKGKVIVRLHYPNTAANIAADPEPSARHAWNLLVAPRFSNLQNFKVASPSLDWQRAILATGNLTNQQGKTVFVALFRKGTSDWLEIELPDKGSFVQSFGFDPDAVGWDASSDIWKPLLALFNYNKFAVGAADLTGTWTNDFSGVLQMYSTVTGNYMGMNAHQSKQSFTFAPGSTYSWKLLVVSGAVGASKYTNATSKGTYTLKGNWQLSFSDIEGKPKTYNVSFSCIKGGRVLWLQDVADGGSATPFGQSAN